MKRGADRRHTGGVGVILVLVVPVRDDEHEETPSLVYFVLGMFLNPLMHAEHDSVRRSSDFEGAQGGGPLLETETRRVEFAKQQGAC